MQHLVAHQDSGVGSCNFPLTAWILEGQLLGGLRVRELWQCRRTGSRGCRTTTATTTTYISSIISLTTATASWTVFVQSSMDGKLSSSIMIAIRMLVDRHFDAQVPSRLMENIDCQFLEILNHLHDHVAPATNICICEADLLLPQDRIHCSRI